MPGPVTSLPDALVMGVGGTVGIAWLQGLLQGLENGAGLEFRRCEYLVGTSAGSVVAAALNAGRFPARSHSPGRPAAFDDGPLSDGSATPLRDLALRWGEALAAPVVPPLLRLGAPGSAAVRRLALRGPLGAAREASSVASWTRQFDGAFDGRLRVVAVDRVTGKRMVFGAPGAPPAGIAEAVQASCAVPWIMGPVNIAGREYVDGGVWSPSNIDVVPAGRGTEVLALLPSAARAPLRSAAGSLSAFTVAAARTEALALKARGARVRTIRPDAASSQAMGPNLMDGGRSAAVADAAYEQGLRLAGAG